VPYADPPAGRLRWRPPVPAAEWAGVRKGTEFGPICPQTAGAVFATRLAEPVNLNEAPSCGYF